MKPFLFQLIINVWIGLLIGISFLEAPLKFKAKGITEKIALSVGQLVFAALNKIETFFSLLLLLILLFNFSKYALVIKSLLLAMVLFVSIQTLFLFPVMNLRIEMIFADKVPIKSSVHFYYVVLEILKLIFLLILSYKLFYDESN